MRAVLVAAVTAIGIGLGGISASAAAPASGHVIAHAAKSGHVVRSVHWRRHHHHWRHCWWYRGHRHCW
jgi:hypothetical protein